MVIGWLKGVKSSGFLSLLTLSEAARGNFLSTPSQIISSGYEL